MIIGCLGYSSFTVVKLLWMVGGDKYVHVKVNSYICMSEKGLFVQVSYNVRLENVRVFEKRKHHNFISLFYSIKYDFWLKDYFSYLLY